VDSWYYRVIHLERLEMPTKYVYVGKWRWTSKELKMADKSADEFKLGASQKQIRVFGSCHYTTSSVAGRWWYFLE
jgi:hypothetical protein